MINARCLVCQCRDASFRVQFLAAEHIARFYPYEDINYTEVTRWPSQAESGIRTYRETWLAHFEKCPEQIRILKSEHGTLLGILRLCEFDLREAFLETSPEVRKSGKYTGCGKALVCRLLLCLLEEEWDTVTFSVAPDAQGFYQKLGFVPITAFNYTIDRKKSASLVRSVIQ